jgi:hypothetical protein
VRFGECHKNCLEQFLTSLSDGPKGGCHEWQATKTSGAFLRASPKGVKRMDALSIKKKTPRLRGLCRLFADILDLPAILAAAPRGPVAKVRFLRDVHEQQINHRPVPGKVVICSTP